MIINELAKTIEPQGPVELLHLTWHHRCRARARHQTDSGTEVAISLPRGTMLADGTVLHNSPERTIVVKASPENVLVIFPDNTRQSNTISHHLGNWHRSLELNEDGSLIAEADGPLEDWLKRTGIKYEAQKRPFQPDLRCAGHD